MSLVPTLALSWLLDRSDHRRCSSGATTPQQGYAQFSPAP